MTSEESARRLTPEDEQALILVAARAIEQGFAVGSRRAIEPEKFSLPLREVGASFVTLKARGKLRGCVGTISPCMPLVADVAKNAHGAAFDDARLPSLNQQELHQLEMTISVLGSIVPLEVHSEQEAIRVLRPGSDGVILRHQEQVATFLPAVWKTLEDPREFLQHLRTKAGLERDFWSPAVRLERYAVHSIRATLPHP